MPPKVFASVRSPKSDALPVVAIVTKSMILVLPDGVILPPADTALVGDEQAAKPSVRLLISPKS